jgi:hypothetical protein
VSFGSYAPGNDPTRLLNTYNELLKEDPSHIGCLIGKGILSAEMLPDNRLSAGQSIAVIQKEFSEVIQILGKARNLLGNAEVRGELDYMIHGLQERTPKPPVLKKP